MKKQTILLMIARVLDFSLNIQTIVTEKFVTIKIWPNNKEKLDIVSILHNLREFAGNREILISSVDHSWKFKIKL